MNTTTNATLVCQRAKYAGGPVKFSRYTSDKTIAIVVGGDCKATVCLPEGAEHPGEFGVWLKGWSENEGLPEALERSGIVVLTGKVAATGFAIAQHAELTPAAIEQFKREDPLAKMEAA